MISEKYVRCFVDSIFTEIRQKEGRGYPLSITYDDIQKYLAPALQAIGTPEECEAHYDHVMAQMRKKAGAA